MQLVSSDIPLYFAIQSSLNDCTETEKNTEVAAVLYMPLAIKMQPNLPFDHIADDGVFNRFAIQFVGHEIHVVDFLFSIFSLSR